MTSFKSVAINLISCYFTFSCVSLSYLADKRDLDDEIWRMCQLLDGAPHYRGTSTSPLRYCRPSVRAFVAQVCAQRKQEKPVQEAGTEKTDLDLIVNT